jgi:methyl coenzyme M reductase alpha subunit
MDKLQELKVAFADASIALEIAQSRYNQIKQALVQELNKPKGENATIPS